MIEIPVEIPASSIGEQLSGLAGGQVFEFACEIVSEAA